MATTTRLDVEVPDAGKDVLDECVAEAWRNAENGDPDAQTPADVAADIVRRLSFVYLGAGR